MFYQCEYFPLKELVPPEMMIYPDHRLWRLFDPVGLITLDALRKRYGAMYVNDYDRNLKYCGYRPPECEVGNMFSQHRFGRGFDPHPLYASASEIRADIKRLSPDQRKAVNLDGIRRMETGISWLHFDTGNYGLVEGKILFFKP